MSTSRWFLSECEVGASLDAFCGMHTVFDCCEIDKDRVDCFKLELQNVSFKVMLFANKTLMRLLLVKFN